MAIFDSLSGVIKPNLVTKCPDNTNTIRCNINKFDESRWNSGTVLSEYGTLTVCA